MQGARTYHARALLLQDIEMKNLHNKIEEYVSCIFFLLIFLLMVGGVFLRYLFGVSFSWNIELARYSFVWLTFIGAAFVRSNDGHIKIELLLNHLKEKRPQLAFYLTTIIRIITIIYLVLIVYLSYHLSIRSWRFKSQAMQIPQFFLYISVCIGSVLYLIHEVKDFIIRIK